MNLVEYRQRARSAHSARLMQADDRDWVRTYEVDPAVHLIIKAGQQAANNSTEEAL
tara:strand:- start:2228 stop:2395 length:168 start_codon:yes stop_codon:yes gene_type:complete